MVNMGTAEPGGIKMVVLRNLQCGVFRMGTEVVWKEMCGIGMKIQTCYRHDCIIEGNG